MNEIKRLICWDDFEKLDIRVGTIINVDKFEEAKKPAYKISIDFGEIGIKKSSAQITDLYNVYDLINKQVVAVTNFPPKQIANFISECLILGVVKNNHDVVLLVPEQKVLNGLKIS